MTDDLFIVNDPDLAGEDDEEAVQPPTTFYGSADEWVRKFLLPSYQRRVAPKGQTGSAGRWDAQWWSSVEAMQRIELLWRMWELVRESPIDLSAWWLNHLDPHMSVLLSPVGPFAESTHENRLGEALPYEAPPQGMFADDLQ